MKPADKIEELGEDDIIEVEETPAAESGTFVARTRTRTTPRLHLAVEWNEVERAEAYVLSLVTAGFTAEAILRISPLDDQRTLAILSKLGTAHCSKQ
jgi:hypothetical protein